MGFKFDDEPPSWQDMWKPVPPSTRLEMILIVLILILPATLVLKALLS